MSQLPSGCVIEAHVELQEARRIQGRGCSGLTRERPRLFRKHLLF